MVNLINLENVSKTWGLKTLLDGVSEGLRHGRHPDKPMARKVAAVLRAVAWAV